MRCRAFAAPAARPNENAQLTPIARRRDQLLWVHARRSARLARRYVSGWLFHASPCRTPRAMAPGLPAGCLPVPATRDLMPLQNESLTPDAIDSAPPFCNLRYAPRLCCCYRSIRPLHRLAAPTIRRAPSAAAFPSSDVPRLRLCTTTRRSSGARRCSAASASTSTCSTSTLRRCELEAGGRGRA